MKNPRILLLVMLFASLCSTAFSQTCSGTRRTIVPWGDGGIYFSGKPGGFNYLALQPGDTLVLGPSVNNYFSLEDVHGTPACPIVIINTGGQVTLTRGFDLRNCSDIKLTGSGVAGLQYGFKVHNPSDWDNNGVAIGIQGRSRNMEVERIYVHKKTYGAWIKQDPTCVDSLNYPNWHMDNVKMHDCRFLNIGQDCIYAGNTDPTGARPVMCNGVETHPVPMRLSNIQIYNLIVDSCMRTGIQLSGCDSGYNAIYNNIVSRCGYELNQQQGTGISIGGMTSNCHVYNNTIRQTFLYGILGLGVGSNYIENNNIDSSGYLGSIVNTYSQPTAIYIDTRASLPFSTSRYEIKNNKVGKNASQDGHDIYWEKSFNTYASGNIICGNKKQDNLTPAVVYTRPGILWTGCGSIPVPVNLAPVANAGPDQSITLPVNTVTLTGSGVDTDGSIVAYQWTKLSGPASFSIASPATAQTAVSSLVAGIYTFELKVTDNGGASGKDTVQVTVSPAPNQLPVVSAGAAQAITLPLNTVQLTGTASDADGSIVSVSWSKISGPSAFTITAASLLQTTVSGLVQGTYAFELRVTDNSGGIAKDTVSVTVNAAPNLAPTAFAGPAQATTLPANSVTLTGSGTDPDGWITGYQWSKVSGPAAHSILSAGSAQTVVSSLAAGTYRFELKVTDNSGATARDTVTVLVNAAPNVPPVVSAGADQTITLPASTVQLNGTASDADGSVVSVSWTKISGPGSYSIASPASLQTTAAQLVQGVYAFELKVQDNDGAIAKDTVLVTVNPAPNVPPTANAGAAITITLPVNSVTLSGSGTDTDGSITAYQWTKISGPAATITNASAAQTTVTGLVQGIYTFQLKVTDNGGATAAAQVQVTVNPAPNVAPVANAGAGIVLTLPANAATLNGSGTDADGSITAYQWTKVSGPAAYAIGNSAAAQTTVSGLVQGIYLFELKVTDNKGATGKDTVKITVNAQPVNLPPVANAGADQTITLPTSTVTLTGSGTDPDGTVVSYLWTKIGGSNCTIVTPGAAQTQVKNLGQGNYSFELKVTDNKGATGKDTVVVKVLKALKGNAVAALYPTVARSTVNVQIEGELPQASTSIRIYDVNGVLVQRDDFLRTSVQQLRQVNVSQLKAGAYFLVVNADAQTDIPLRFIKQ